MANPLIDAFTGTDMDQLLRGSDQCGLSLPCRVFGERMQHDEAHLVVQTLEAAERVEHAIAPQKLVGGSRQLIAIGAELQLL